MHCQARSSPILNNVTKMHAILHLCNSPTLYTSEITQYTIPLAVSHERIQPHVLLAPPRQERAASQQDFAWLYLDSLVCTISYILCVAASTDRFVVSVTPGMCWPACQWLSNLSIRWFTTLLHFSKILFWVSGRCTPLKLHIFRIGSSRATVRCRYLCVL